MPVYPNKSREEVKLTVHFAINRNSVCLFFSFRKKKKQNKKKKKKTKKKKKKKQTNKKNNICIVVNLKCRTHVSAM